MDMFHKFPSTPHLFWLGRDAPRDDKILSPADADAFLAGQVILEEKVDGANVGLSFSANGELRIQNRGQYLAAREAGQFKGIRTWAERSAAELFDVLCDSLILFGEWCYAQHSVHYASLPDWFLGFDVFDPEADAFWSLEKRNRLLDQVRLPKVAEVARGNMTRIDILEMLDKPSAYGAACIEGLYLRRESAGFLDQRAKIVRAEFATGITEHWSRKPMTLNESRTSYG